MIAPILPETHHNYKNSLKPFTASSGKKALSQGRFFALTIPNACLKLLILFTK